MVSLLDPVQTHADATPRRPAIRDTSGDVSYADLLDRALRFGTVVAEGTEAKGARVILIAPSTPSYVVAYLGIQAAGRVVVPMNTMSTVDEITYVLRDSDATMVIAWHAVSEQARSACVAEGVPLVELQPGLWEGHPPTTPADRAPSDTAAIMYTSGTTGRPKGAELTVSNILAAAAISVECSGGTSDDRIGTGLPLFHIFGQISVMMASLTGGGSLSLISPFTPESMIDAISTYRLTIVAGVPTMWNAMMNSPASYSGDSFEDVRIAVSGGASLPTPIARSFEERFGCELLEGYGLTESTSLGTFNGFGAAVPGSVGRAVPDTAVEVRDADGTPVGPGVVGEVFISGPSVMKCYFRRPEETAATLVDGWLRTGDLGMFDESANLFIVDRLKDLIIRGGYNVYPGEVEEILYEHPGVVEVAVVGVPDDYYGEEVAAVIVLRPSANITGPEVTAWARERMSAYKIPRIVKFVETLPKGSTGKIMKRSIDVALLR